MPLDIPILPFTANNPLFGIRSLLDSKPCYSNLALGCENILGPHDRNSTEVLALCHDRALRTEGLGLQGFKMLVSVFGKFGTGQ